MVPVRNVDVSGLDRGFHRGSPAHSALGHLKRLNVFVSSVLHPLASAITMA